MPSPTAPPTARSRSPDGSISDEGPALPPRGADPQTLTRMSPAALLGQWHDVERPRRLPALLVADEAAAGPLDAISSPAPAEGSGVNWLNIFYAVEWAVFAGFAFYLWYRLAARRVGERRSRTLEDGRRMPAAARPSVHVPTRARDAARRRG